MALSKLQNFQAEVRKLVSNPPVFTYRERVAVGSINGATDYSLLKPISGYKYKLVDAIIIAIGGTTAGGTSVRIKATQSGSAVYLIVAALAGLARHAVARAGATNIAVLNDGASFADCDAGTGISVDANGTFTGNTHFDIQLTYTLEKV